MTAVPPPATASEAPHIGAIPVARPTAVIAVTCTREEIQQVMGQGVRELMDAIAAQGAKPDGALFTHHRRRPTDTFDFEIGIAVDRPVGPAGRMRPSEWPAMRVARAVHRGRYEDLATSWIALHAWTEAQGLATAPDLWECYLAGPETGQDASAWRTELNRPLRD